MNSYNREADLGKELVLRLRMGFQDAHYGGNLVDGARILQLFGDVATALLVHRNGDEGLFRAYEMVEFLAPVRAGDYIEARGKIIEEGRTSHKMDFVAYKIIEAHPHKGDSVAEVLDPPKLVCKARGTCVNPKASQRGEGCK